MPNELPEGFVLDAPSPKSNALPEGFQLDPPAKPKPVAGFWSSFGHEAATSLDLPKALDYAATQDSPYFTQEEKDKIRRKFLAAREPNERQLNWKDVHGVGDFLTYGAEAAGNLAGYVAAPMAIGAMSGPAAIGTTPATFFAQHEVNNLESQARAQEADIAAGKKPREVSTGKSLVASAGQTAFDVFGGKLFTSIPGVNKMMGKMPILRDLVGESAEPLEGETAEQAAARASKEAQDKIIQASQDGKLTYKNGIAKGVAKGVGFAVPQSLASTILDRWQSGESNDVFNDPDAAHAWRDSLLQGAVLGMTLGVGEGAFHTRAERKQAADLIGQRKAEEKAAAEAAADAEKKITETPKTADPLLGQARDVIMATGDATRADHIAALMAQVKDEDGNPIPHSKATSLFNALTKKSAGDMQVKFSKPDPQTGVLSIKNKLTGEEEAPAAAPHTTEDLLAEPAAVAETHVDDPTSHKGTVDPDNTLAQEDAEGKNADDVGALAPGEATTPPHQTVQDEGAVRGKTDTEVSGSEGGDTGDNTGGTGGGAKLPTLSDPADEQRIGRVDSEGVDNTKPSTPTTDEGTAGEQPPVASEPPPIIPPIETPPVADPPPKPAEVTPVHDKGQIESDLRAMADANGNIKGSDAAEYVRTHSPNAFHRYIAGLVGKMVGHFERAGFKINVRFEDPNNPHTSSSSIKSGSSGVTSSDLRDSGTDANTITILLSGNNLRTAKRPARFRDGTPTTIEAYPEQAKNPDTIAGHDTILHELIHAVTTHAIEYGAYYAQNNADIPASRRSKSYLVDAYNDLAALHKHVVDRINKIPDNKLSPVEKRLKNFSNMMDNPHELLAWGLSDPEAAEWLSTVPYKSGGKLTNAWRAIVDTVAKILGVDPAKKNALNELLRVSEKYIGKDSTKQVLALRKKYSKEPTYLTDVTFAQSKVGAGERHSDHLFDQTALGEAANQTSGSREKLINMPIDDFLSMARSFSDNANGKPSEGKLRSIRNALSETGKLPTGVGGRIPFLKFRNTEHGWAEVTGHEGRHRALALKEQGYTHMPVVLESDSGHTIRWGKQDNPDHMDYVQNWPHTLFGERDSADSTGHGNNRIDFPVTREAATEERRVRAQRKTAPKAPTTPEEWERLRAEELEAKSLKGKVKQSIMDLWKGAKSGAYDKLVTLFQNEWRPLKLLEHMRDLANSNVIGGDKATNIYTNLIGAMDRASSLMAMHLNPLFQEVRNQIRSFAKNNDLSWNEALARLDGMRVSLHEPERRRTVFVREAPLKTAPRAYQDANGNTVMMSPADRRQRILDKIADANVSAADKEKLEQALHKMVFEKDAKGNFVNLDENGHSPTKGKGPKSIDENSPEYNVVGGYNSDFIKQLRQGYDDATANGANPEINRIFDLLKEIEAKGREFDRAANYWTNYTDGIVAAYGWKNYVPFKGLGGQEAKFELNGKYKGVSGEHADAPNAFEARESEADNSLLQTMVDASRAAGRAGRKDVTKILKNLINAKDGMGINGKLVKTLTAQERYENKVDMSEYKKRGNFFHYMPNGDIEVYSLTKDPEILDAIRRPFEEAGPVQRVLNGLTGFMGKQHTRYNLAFAPMNYVKHTLSNAYNLAGHAGLGTAVDYLGATVGNTGNMLKAATFAKHLVSGDADAIDKMRNSSDPFIRNMVEYMEEGGRTTYGQTYSITSKMDDIKKTVGRGNVLHNAQQIAHYFDAYQDMFDLTSRTSAYGVIKQKLMQEGMTEPQARELAAAQAKELTNYRLIGKYGRSAGGLFMFFRPAASSAVAAIDTLRPAFQSVESVLAKYPESVLKDPAKKQAIIDNHVKLQQNTKRLAVSLVGAGAALYTMAFLASGNDEQGRNRVASDDKARWTRYMRLPILGDAANGFFQLPWGFGLGGLGALGAQLAALSYGHQKPSEAAGNIINIAAESFLPITPSHINPTDNLFAFMLDTVTPSGLRPWVEYAMNRDDMGNEIFNARQGKYSDVFTGGDHIPQGYKDIARMLYRLTDYKLEVSPNTLYFFATHYFDAIGRIANMGYDLKLMADGNKHFDYKHDLPLTDSFVGTYSNVDARQWQEIQKQLDEKSRTLNTLKKTDSDAYVKYMMEHPTEQFLVNNYHHMANAQLKELAARRLSIQLAPDEQIPPLQREEIVKEIRLHENAIKSNLIARYHEMGIDP